MREATKCICIRLPETDWKRLREKAGKVGLSAGRYLKQRTIADLDNEDHLRMFDELVGMVDQLAGIHDDVTKLRKDLATATCAILADGGKAKADEAMLFVNENFSE